MTFNPNAPSTIGQCTFRNGDVLIPSLLFKFRSFSDDYHLRVLTHRELYLTPPILFNDPFDCRIATDYRECRGPELRRVLRRSAPPGITRVEGEMLIQNAVREKPHLDFELQVKVMEESLTDVGVLATSASWSNILLWSHYSNNHQGYCVGFDTKSFADDLSRRYEKYPQTGLVFPYTVNYGDYPRLLPFSGSIEDRVRQTLVSKAPDWKYEEEIRFIAFEIPEHRRVIDIAPQTIDTILLGVSIKPDKKQWILKVLNKDFPHVKVWQAMRKEYAFGLDFVRL